MVDLTEEEVVVVAAEVAAEEVEGELKHHTGLAITYLKAVVVVAVVVEEKVE